MAKTIHTVLYDDILDGSRIVTMDNCVCQLYDIKRDYDAIIKDARENLSKPALYVSRTDPPIRCVAELFKRYQQLTK